MYAQNARPGNVPSSGIIYEVNNDYNNDDNNDDSNDDNNDDKDYDEYDAKLSVLIEFVMEESALLHAWSLYNLVFCQIFHGDADLEEKWKCWK